jgi:hypothetical protein
MESAGNCDASDNDDEVVAAEESHFARRAEQRRVKRSVTANFGYMPQPCNAMTLAGSLLWQRRSGLR